MCVCGGEGSQARRSLEDGMGSGGIWCVLERWDVRQREGRGRREASEGRKWSGRDESRQRIGLACLPLGPLHCTQSLDMRQVSRTKRAKLDQIDYHYILLAILCRVFARCSALLLCSHSPPIHAGCHPLTRGRDRAGLAPQNLPRII